MDDQWAQLSGEERRERRLARFRTPAVQFVGPEAEEAYKTRIERFIDAYKVEEPDRVPVALPVGALPAYLYGSDYRTVMYDYDKATEVWLRFNEEFECDHLVSPAMLLPREILRAPRLQALCLAWPRHAGRGQRVPVRRGRVHEGGRI